MSDVKISDLSPAGTLGGTEALPVVQLGSTVKASVAQVGTFLTTLALPLVLGAAAQPGITSVGTLSSLTVSGSGGNVVLGGPFYALHVVGAGITYLEGNLVGVSGRSVSGFDLAIFPVSLTTAKIIPVSATPLSIRDFADTTDLITVDETSGAADFYGAVTCHAALNATLSTAAQPNVTSIGTLASLGVTGDLTLGGRLVLSTAVSKVVPGATSLSLRNHADSADNILIADNGNVTFRGTLSGATNITAGGLTVTSGGGVAIFVTGSTSAGVDISSAAGTVRDLVWQTAGVNRWVARVDTTAESGSNAGSAFVLIARDDTGATIDNVISIVRAAGGTMSLNRPVAFAQAIGIGNGVSTSAIINVGVGGLAAFTGTTQDGMLLLMTGNSSATTAINGLRVRGATAAAAFTVTALAGLHVLDAVLGAGSTITTQYGILVDAQSQGATAIGIQVSQGTLATGILIGQSSGTTQAGLIITGGTITGSAAVSGIAIVQTWNTSGGPRAILVNVTNTASGATARLLDLQVAAASMFSVDPVGRIRSIAMSLVPVTAGVAIIVTQQAAMTVDAFQIASGTLTGSTAVSLLNLAQTWNTTGAPLGILLNITNTASGAGARLLDLQVAGSSKHAVDVAGTLYIAGTQVVSTRKTGWTAWTGTALRTTVATGSATTLQVAEAFKALLDDLISHGLVGT